MKNNRSKELKCIIDELPDQRVGMSKEDHALGPKHYPKAEHTPTPWTADIINNWPEEQEMANREFMLRAVNSHEALLEAANHILFLSCNKYTDEQWRNGFIKLSEAVAKAEGK